MYLHTDDACAISAPLEKFEAITLREFSGEFYQSLYQTFKLDRWFPKLYSVFLAHRLPKIQLYTYKTDLLFSFIGDVDKINRGNFISSNGIPIIKRYPLLYISKKG